MEENPPSIDDIHPALRPVVKEFLLKCKYPFKFVIEGYYQTVDEGGTQKDYRSTVSFYDPAFPNYFERIGALKWSCDNNPQPIFRTVSRNTLNMRFNDSERRRSVDTRNPKRAVRAMLEHITPLTIQEVAVKTRRLAETAVSDWRMEHMPKELDNANFTGKMSRESVYREFQNLLAQNVTFITDEFKAVVNTGLQNYEIYKERYNTPISLWYVNFDNAGIMVLTPDNIVTRFTAFEMLPDFIQEGVSVLRISPDTQIIPGLGVTVSSTAYWVIKKG